MNCPLCGFAVSPMLFRCGNCNAVLPPPPGVTPAVATPGSWTAEPRILAINGLGTAAIVGFCLTVVAWIGLLWPVIQFVATRRQGEGGPLTEHVYVTVLVAGGLVTFATTVVFITWLYRVRRNLDFFSDAMPLWSAGWTIGAWFIPVANILIVPAVVADVARNMCDDPSDRVRRRIVGRVRTWWINYLLSRLVLVLALLFPATFGYLDRAFAIEVGGTSVLVTPFLILLGISVITAIVAAIMICGVIAFVGAEQRQRLARVWGPAFVR